MLAGALEDVDESLPLTSRSKHHVKHASMSDHEFDGFRQRRDTLQLMQNAIKLTGPPSPNTGSPSYDHEQSETSYGSRFETKEKEMLIELNALEADQWQWDHVKVWLKHNKFHDLITVFEKENENKGLTGDKLLDWQYHDFIGKELSGQELNQLSVSKNATLKRFMGLITKLKLEVESDENPNKRKDHCDVRDYFEIKRRLQMFQSKWDKILWIEYYVDKYEEPPTPKIFSEEQGVSMEIAKAYMKIYEGDKDKLLSKDLDELLQGFNPYNDCVLFWSVIIALLKVRNSQSLFRVFARVAEISPGSVSIKLLNKYKLELSRYESEQVDKITQNVVIGSKYPVCAALRISTWFKDRAVYDVSRAEEWIRISESYVEAAVDYLSNIRSDHFATILLECKSDIENRSALDMALDYRVTSFVKNNRVERVANSIMNDFEFLRIENISDAFEIDEITLGSLIKKLEDSHFYFTPLGTFITELMLYIIYLALFTYLSISGFRVYDAMGSDELLFWVMNMGYVFNEAQALISDGVKEYYEDRTNYMDTCISLLFCTSLAIRITGFAQGASMHCVPEPLCYQDSTIYTMFMILWSLATMLLWMRLFTFMILSHSLGPMVLMILRMMKDIATFFKIMLVLFLGFSMCLMYVLKDVHSDFESPFTSTLTLLRALLGDFDFGAFANAEDVNDSLLYYGIAVMLIYLVIGSLVFLNLLIAMMAKTFDSIQDDTTSAIVFSRFQLAMIYDNNPAFMPPPLNVLAIAFFALFYLCEGLMKCCCNNSKADLAIPLMPRWMKRRNLEIDDQIVNKDGDKKFVMETNLGDETHCAITDYRPDIMKHKVIFDKDVSVGDSIMIQRVWLLDLWELKDEGAITFDQFYSNVDEDWTATAHASMETHSRTTNTFFKCISGSAHRHSEPRTQSPYWICRYCRGYVKRSAVSIKRLGRELRVSDLEMKLILSHSPEICPNCYRHREECQRWELVWEIISFLMFEPLRYIMWGLLSAIAWIFQISDVKNNDDDDDDDDEIETHIYEETLLQQLKKEIEDELWDNKQSVIWKTLIKAKENVEDSLLKKQIESHIMNKSIEDDHTYFEFQKTFVEFEQFRTFDDRTWTDYFEKLTNVIFKTIKKETSEKQPLQLFARYPFDVHMVLDEFDDWWDKYAGAQKSIKECDRNDKDLQRMLRELNLFNSEKEEIDNQLKIILEDVDKDEDKRQLEVESEESVDENKQSHEYLKVEMNDHDPKNNETPFYNKFIHYLHRVQSLFQNPRKINNLIRDTNRAIVERGVTEFVVEDELYLLFEDIEDASEAIPFFNAMRVETKDGEQKVALWTLLNTLKCLYFLHHCVKDQVLTKNAHIYVNKKGLLRLVFEQFRDEIVDPDDILKDYGDEDCDGEVKQDDLPSQSQEKRIDFNKISDDNIDLLEKDNSAQMENQRQMRKERRELRNRCVALFSKSEITAKAVEREIGAIYDTIKQKRKEKISVTNIDFYRRQMKVKLLEDEVSMNYVMNQLSRYATFYAEKTMNDECTFAYLYKVLTRRKPFQLVEGKSQMYKIDEQMIPDFCTNLSFVRQLHQHVADIYERLEFVRHLHKHMTILDVLSIILIYDRVFDETDKQMESISDKFIVSHPVFCKFVDADFKIGSESISDAINPKAQIASNLYQSVLDVQQNFVTLGEAYQTIVKLIKDIDGMKCGEPYRIKRWIETEKENEEQRYQVRRSEWMEEHGTKDGVTIVGGSDDEKEEDAMKTHKSQLSMDFQEFENNESELHEVLNGNPAINLKHVDEKEWERFVKAISEGKGLIDNRECVAFRQQPMGVIKEERKGDEWLIIDTIYEFTAKIDIIKEGKTKAAEDAKAKPKRRKKRQNVFKIMLQFNADRITLQQFFVFSYRMHRFLQKNDKVNDLMRKYKESTDEQLNHLMNQTLYEEEENKEKKEQKKLFKKTYFGEKTTYSGVEIDIKEEIEWFADGTRTVGQLCHRLYPFWSLELIQSIHEFLESTHTIVGTYELKAAEFKQFKHELNVNDALAHDLFHMIRCKERSLSWEQCRRYFDFLLEQRYRIKKAILKSSELEDTTISKDALKTTLEISSNDEAKWLFNTVEEVHGAKVTWKQMRNYLAKMVSVRVSMRDFFNDQQRDREFDENQAEEFHNAMEEERDRDGDIKNQIQELKNQIQELKELLLNQNKTNIM